ncbi:MAG: iron-sulfur cluster assembly scaffold protein [Candidatus Jordarchaeum sp.]|uniref:iron-sulfur cluster assembly scaffold protein n=1 Tax=Candidatus Jordarchaeum sp. TaxID=2823881 RepID=UPI00404AD59B
MYSEKVIDHFTNPRNVGEIENANGVGTVGNPADGDVVTIYVEIEDNILKDVKFKAFGCAAAIATGSMTTELAKGKTVEEALKINREDVARELGGLPDRKNECSNLGAAALHEAINDYLGKKF